MSALLEEPTLTTEAKSRELCHFIADQPAFIQAHDAIEAFLEDDNAKATYAAWQERSQELHAMGSQGRQPSPSDLAALESTKEAVLANPLAAGFVAAEDEMNSIFSTVTKLLQKTLQNGRVPTEEEMAEAASGCCGGGGCGC